MEVKLLDKMGTDISVVNAARVSFAKESAYQDIVTKVVKEADINLLHYLAEHNHWSPFAHTQLQFRVKAPIFVARQLAKHQVGGAWNEVSRRYVDDAPEFYEPDVWRMAAENKKQGSGKKSVDVDGAGTSWILFDALEIYLDLLARGVCPEQARMVLPQSMMTEWIWTGSLLFFSRVVKLRTGDDAQAETRELVLKIAAWCAAEFPEAWKALEDN